MSDVNDDKKDVLDLQNLLGESAEQLDQVSKDAAEKMNVALTESKEKLQKEVEVLSSTLQDQFQKFKSELTEKISQAKTGTQSSQQDWALLKDTFKQEFEHLVKDVSELGKEIKAEVTELTEKHTASWAKSFQRAKMQTEETIKKTKQTKLYIVKDENEAEN